MKFTLRNGSAMIELIFALVVMGLVLMSAPMLISTATKSTFTGLQQESINEAASHINMVMGYHWDEADADTLHIDPILAVSAVGDSNLSYFKNGGWRIGTPNTSARSIIRDDGIKNLAATAPAALGADAGEPPEDDVDDFNGNSYTLKQYNTTTSDVIDKDISIATMVSYAIDSPSGGSGPYDTTGGDGKIQFNPITDTAAGSTNIKHIRVTLTTTNAANELDKTIILNAFTCNIGGYTLEEKTF